MQIVLRFLKGRFCVEQKKGYTADRWESEPSCKSIKLKTNQNENEQLTVKCFTLYCCNALTCGCRCCCGVLIFFSSSHAEHVASGQLFLKKHWTNESLRFSFTELECGANYLWWNRAIATIPLSRRRKRRRGRRYCERTCYVSKRVDDKKTALYVAIDWIFSLQTLLLLLDARYQTREI